MQNGRPTVNWDDLRLFLAACQAGNLREGAKRIGLDQSTMSRRMEALEHALRVQLFIRSNRGIAITDAARALVEHAERMEAVMIEVERSVWKQDTELHGTIKVASSDGFGPFWITPHLEEFQSRYPNILIEMICGEVDPDLERSEAHLIFRLGTLTRPNLECVKVGEMRFELFASQKYIDSHGRPKTRHELLAGNHRLLSLYQTEQTSVSDTIWHDWDNLCSQAGKVFYRTNSSAALIKATTSGIGISLMSVYIDRQFPGLIRLEPEGWRKPALPIVLIYHESAKQLKRVSLLIDYLTVACRTEYWNSAEA